MNFIASSVLVFAIFNSNAWAAGACADPKTMDEITSCEKEKYEVQDKLLNEAFKSLLSTFPRENDLGIAGDTPRTMLVKAQKKWIAFRDADCQTKYQIYGTGSIRFMTMYVCLRERTEQRIVELQVKEWMHG